MTATLLQLPIVEQQAPTLFPEPPSPHVLYVESRGPALQPAPETGSREVFALNISRGCFHRCAFCAVRGMANYPGDAVLSLYSNAAKQLAADLAVREQLPRAVFVGPSMDPFPPHADVQAVTGEVVETLAEHGVEAWLMTRGLIRPAIMNELTKHRRFVKVTVPITTLRRDLQRSLEQWTAPPRLRIRQIAELRRRGIAVQVSLEPLIPELTDTVENLTPLLRQLAAAGVQRLTASYLFLRDGIAENMRKALGEPAWALVEEAYTDGPLLAPVGQGSARFLPRSRRQRGYAHLMALAAEHGIAVSISRLSNPDFGGVVPDRDATRPGLLTQFLRSAKTSSRLNQN